MRCSFVPPYLLRQIATAPGLGVDVGSDVAAACEATLRVDGAFRDHRSRVAAGLRPPSTGPGGWLVHTAANRDELPGNPVRSDAQPESGDVAVDEAWSGIRAALAMFEEVYGRTSYDGMGARVLATVHYRRDYDNAFWDGSQLVFGDGDGKIFGRLTGPVDVLGHELTHAVTEHSAGLEYAGQPGALNESISDVFGSCLKQRLLGQTTAEADWLIGAGLFLPGVNARGIRDLAAPGTAYDDPVLGRDPQAGHMDGYIETTDDNGGVHLNSGIPNKAFWAAATAIGGNSWEGAGRIWYAALTGDLVTPTTDFAGFAAATVAVAGEQADAVATAWTSVGVDPAGPAPADPPAPPSGSVVRVNRSGGFAGMSTTGEVDLSSDDPRVPAVRALVERVDLASLQEGRPQPDRFVYAFTMPDGETVRVHEQALTPELDELARLVLAKPQR